MKSQSLFLISITISKVLRLQLLLLQVLIEIEIKNKIINIFEDQLNCKIELDEKIDISVLGGFRIIIDGKYMMQLFQTSYKN